MHRDLPHGDFPPPGPLPLGQEDGQGLPQDGHLAAALLREQDVPQLLPGDTQSHQGPQYIPVPRVGILGKHALHRRYRTLRVVRHVLRLLPVGEKDAGGPLGVGVAAPKQTSGRPAQPQQVLHRRPLPGGEEGRVGGHPPVLGQLQLVHHPGQQHPLLPAAGTAVQQVFFVHGRSPPPRLFCETLSIGSIGSGRFFCQWKSPDFSESA